MNKKSNIHPAPEGSRQFRCGCRQLLAQLTPDGVEIKCKRCKQVSVVSWNKMRPEVFNPEPDPA